MTAQNFPFHLPLFETGSMEAKQRELQAAVNDMMSKIEVEKLRPLQRNMYLKLAECYNSKSASMEDVQRCAHQTQAPLQHADQFLQNEMAQMQNRLQRCSMACQDEVQDRFPNATQPHPQAEAFAEKCLISCVDKHMAMLKSMKYNIESKLDDLKR